MKQVKLIAATQLIVIFFLLLNLSYCGTNAQTYLSNGRFQQYQWGPPPGIVQKINVAGTHSQGQLTPNFNKNQIYPYGISSVQSNFDFE